MKTSYHFLTNANPIAVTNIPTTITITMIAAITAKKIQKGQLFILVHIYYIILRNVCCNFFLFEIFYKYL